MNEVKAGKLDEYSIRRNQLGISTIVYTSVTFNKPLTRDALYPAVAQVISNNIPLALNIFNAKAKEPVRRPISKVDLDDVVEFHPEWDIEQFVDEKFENVSDNFRYDVDKPLWKVYILNKEQNLAVFAFDHAVFDGTSGSIFVKQLAAALNSSSDELPKLDSTIVATPDIKQTPPIEGFGQTKPPILYVLKFLAKLFKDNIFGGPKKYIGAPAAAPIDQKTISRVIDTEQTARIAKAAKEKGVTVHAVLSTALLQTVVASFVEGEDLTDTIVSIATPINARRYLPAITEKKMGNFVYSYNDQFKDDFASFKAGYDGKSFNDKWAKQIYASLKEAMKERKEIAYLIGMLGFVDLKDHLEGEIKNKRRRESVEVSNLGLIQFSEGEYKVKQVSLGQPVTGVSAPFNVSVATVKNGPMTLVVSCSADDAAKTRCHTIWNGMKQILDNL